MTVYKHWFNVILWPNGIYDTRYRMVEYEEKRRVTKYNRNMP